MYNVPPLSGVTADSRQVKVGDMFIAIPGHKTDGRQYIKDAIAKGAVQIVVPTGTDRIAEANQVTWIETDNPRQYLSAAAAYLYQRQPAHIVAVTGTNGKTSTVNFCRQIWSKLSINGASLGTLGLIADGLNDYNGMTTPDAVALHYNLQQLHDHGVTHLALEASSQGMDQDRLYGMTFKAAGFTNLTQDHLDYHQTMDTYLNAKLRLARELLDKDGIAILNADDPAHESFAKVCRERGISVHTYGFNGYEYKIKNRRPVPNGQILDLEILGNSMQIHLPLVGLFQAMNVLCATGMVCADARVKKDDVLNILETLDGVAGRLQKVNVNIEGIGAYIDYAHTPDGLQNVLEALRPHTAGRLICVFGCGGDRDRRKRPIMGEIAARLADIAIVTDDNPRSENPEAIRNEILVGALNAVSIGGRQQAIRYATSLLQNGDVLVVAGKGHEQGQIFATHTDPFDDYTETLNALQLYYPTSI